MAVDEDEAGDVRQREAGRHAAGEGKNRPADAESQDQEERPEEVRDREHGDAGEVRRRLAPRAANAKHDEAAAKADDEREQEREEGELDGRRQGLADQVHHGVPQPDAVPEVALHRAFEPDDVLFDDAAVEPVIGPELGHVRRRRVGRDHQRQRIGRQEPEDHEDHHGDDQEHRHQDREAPDQNAEDQPQHTAGSEAPGGRPGRCRVTRRARVRS